MNKKHINKTKNTFNLQQNKTVNKAYEHDIYPIYQHNLSDYLLVQIHMLDCI
jgi:hypothetical protein